MCRCKATRGSLDRLDVLGRGSTAAANETSAGFDETLGVARHVFGRAEIDAAPFDGARQAGIRLRSELLSRHRSHALKRFLHAGGPNAAIDADQVRAPSVERPGKIFRRKFRLEYGRRPEP